MTELDLVREWFRFAGDDLFTAKHMCYDLYPPEAGSGLLSQSAGCGKGPERVPYTFHAARTGVYA